MRSRPALLAALDDMVVLPDVVNLLRMDGPARTTWPTPLHATVYKKPKTPGSRSTPRRAMPSRPATATTPVWAFPTPRIPTRSWTSGDISLRRCGGLLENALIRNASRPPDAISATMLARHNGEKGSFLRPACRNLRVLDAGFASEEDAEALRQKCGTPRAWPVRSPWFRAER